MSDPVKCRRCGYVLVGEDEKGWYYQAPYSAPGYPELVFMDRVHECGVHSRPHDTGLIYVVMVADRHSDVEPYPFTHRGEAIAFAETQVDGTGEQDRELTALMETAGWVWFCSWGLESDSAWVIRKALL
jgi:hypothetical protein